MAIGHRPTFISIGPGRCATSWLHQSLEAHAEIAMASVKETEYFNTFYDRSAAWYESHFKSHAPAVGEISSNYYLDPDVAKRIRDYDPSIRIIINLRNPFTLLQSFYNFGVRRGMELNSLAQSMDVPIGSLMGSGFASRKKRNSLTPSDTVTLLDSVCLHDRLKPFLEVFPNDQIHFFIFEELQYDWQAALSNAYKFLGVAADFEPEGASQIVNSSVVPKSKLVARLATNTASLLRSVGMYRLLSTLHRSNLVKKILFNSNKEGSELSNLRSTLDPTVVKRLDAQIERLKAMHRPLNKLWKED
ncbi:sulfotransferase domain-containing protein [Mariniblastus fucicola]|nr:sulfotransferase domain-containing protein [Mariniblastus fucicola]